MGILELDKIGYLHRKSFSMKILSILMTLCLLTLGSTHELDDKLRSYLDSDSEYLLKFYKHRHQNPEISLMEKQTASELAAE